MTVVPSASPQRLVRALPPGEDRERLMCESCGFVVYENPKIVVGAVATWEDRILLCRRAVNPRKGYWTIPAGFLELGETAAEGAVREAWEEARARIEIDTLLGVYNVPRISQVQLIYRAGLASPSIEPGPESLECRLATWDEIPWEEIAFPTVTWALEYHRQMRGRDAFPPHIEPHAQRGAAPLE